MKQTNGKKKVIVETQTKLEKFRKFRGGGEERDKYWLVGAILAPLIIGLAVKFLAGGTYYLGEFPVTTGIVSGVGIFINFIATYFFCFDRAKNPSKLNIVAGMVGFFPLLILVSIPHAWLLGWI